MKKFTSIVFALVLFISPLFCHELSIASKVDLERVAFNWLAIINSVLVDESVYEYQMAYKDVIKSGEDVVAYIYHLAPVGHIVVTPYEELHPVKSLSLTTNFDSKSGGYEKSVVFELESVISYLATYDEGGSKQVDDAIDSNRQEWSKFTQLRLNKNAQITSITNEAESRQDVITYQILDDKGQELLLANADPLLATKWDQGAPYWNYCPQYGGKQCYVGCVATAMAQIMRFHKWPKKGRGYSAYYWSKGRKYLSATFSDSYDWENMPNETYEINTQKEKDAVAELSYEAGISVDMDYSSSGSYANFKDVPWALYSYFRYKYKPNLVLRPNYSYYSWLAKLKRQRDLLRPALLGIQSYSQGGHAVVMDGYMGNLVHINMGWDGNKDAYYNIDNIYIFNAWNWASAVIDIIPDAAVITLNKQSIDVSEMEGASNPSPKYFKVINTGSIPMTFRYVSENSWLSASAISDRKSDNWVQIEVFIDIARLVEGNYVGKIRIESDDASNSPQYFTVNLTILPPPIYPPINFSGSLVENMSLSYTESINVLTWGANPQNKNIVKYRLYRIEGLSVKHISELEANNREFWDRDVVPNGNYRYMIKAVNSSNRVGEPAYTEIR